MKIAVIGGGISGVSIARLLKTSCDVTVYEARPRIGGLIACEDLPAGLYHKLGGHVFNSKVQRVSDWFWGHFDRQREFVQLVRNARILLDGENINYPIENNLYRLPEADCKRILVELIEAHTTHSSSAAALNMRDFFLQTFGKTLSERYFFPYNEKIWRCDLSEIPLGWLEGKLPMPNLQEILLFNVLRKEETAMVHSRFYYPRKGGSQFVIDRLAEGLDIRCGVPVTALSRSADRRWRVNDFPERYDHVVYCGDIRDLDRLLGEPLPIDRAEDVSSLRTRGITNAFCRCDTTDTSWLYLPGQEFSANRIIYTGAFSPENNHQDRMTCVVEFLFGESEERINQDLNRLPGRLELVRLNHVRDAYIIQQPNTRVVMDGLKKQLALRRLHLLGRFAEWEYYNIDKCIESAMNVQSLIVPSEQRLSA